MDITTSPSLALCGIPSILGHNRIAFLAPCGIPSIHGHKILIYFFRFQKNAFSLLVAGVFLCLTVFHTNANALPQAIDYNPLETRDQNLFNLIHGQALPTNAALLKNSQSSWSSSLNITNTLNIESINGENIFLDYESYRFNFSYQYGISEYWNIKLDVPLIHQSGGTFDSAIDRWHEFWGLPRANRPFFEENQYIIQYSDQNQGLIDLNETSTTLGDIQIAAARSLIENDSTTMSVWAGIKLPTGDSNKLSGSGATDLSAWLALNKRLSDHWLVNLNVGAVFLGDDDYKSIPLSDSALYGHIMLGWLLTDSINLKVQLQGHTSYYDDSQLKILGDTYILSFGGSIKINQCNQLDLAMSEDIKMRASPDVSLIINWRYFPANNHQTGDHPGRC